MLSQSVESIHKLTLAAGHRALIDDIFDGGRSADCLS